MRETSEIRDLAVSTPSLIRGIRAGLRATVTMGKWSLILAPETGESEPEKREVTFIVDGEPRTLKPFGKIATELYNLESDPKQERNLLNEEKDAARKIKERFIEFLSELNADKEIINQWLKCRGISNAEQERR